MRAPAALVVLAACRAPAPEPPPGAPRTAVIVVLDTTRADAPSYAGGRPGLTPRLDALAADARVFTEARAAAPWTLPSHATLFTGLLPHEHGCHGGTLAFDGRVPLLAERLAEAGYRTGAFSNNPWVSEHTGLLAGFDTVVDVFPRSHNTFRGVSRFADPWGIGLADAGAARTVASVDRWLDEVGDAPVFLFVNLIEAHLPYDPPDGWRGRTLDPAPTIAEVRAFNERWLVDAHAGRLDDGERRRARALYDAEVAYLDARLGELLDALAAHGRLDDALLVVTSDHGEAMGEHRVDGIDLVDHQLGVHEELLRVPLVLRWPGRVAPGVEERPVGLVQVAPTLLAAAGLDDEAARDGLAEPPDPDRPLAADYQPPRIHEDVLAAYVPDEQLRRRLVARGFRAVRRGRWKLVVPDDGPARLYDLAADPGETRDLAAEADPALLAALREALPPPHEGGAAGTISAGTVEALKALGYVR